MPDSAHYVPVAVPQNAPTPPAPLRLLPRDTPASVLEAAGRVVSAAFAREQIGRLLSGGVPGLTDARMIRTVTTGTLDLEVYVIEGGDKIQGVMVVKPPGFEGRSSPNSDGPHTLPAKELEKQAPELGERFSSLLDLFVDLEREAFGPRDVQDIYYISHIGVDPAAQGLGIGKQFCQYIVARCAREGVAASLITMTPRHVTYYEQFGFKTRAYREMEIAGELTRWWAMSTDVEGTGATLNAEGQGSS